jgi:hypothetical protein
MSSVVISGDTSGAITLSAPAVSGTNTATLPAATGTVMVSGNMPAFAVYLGTSDQSVSNNTYTKVQFNTEVFDTANCFDSTTNYRFTPNVAGYYQFNWTVTATSASNQLRYIIPLYKNGSAYSYGAYGVPYASVTGIGSSSAVVYMNGTTDYVEVYGFITGTTNVFTNGSNQTLFSGSLVRAA